MWTPSTRSSWTGSRPAHDPRANDDRRDAFIPADSLRTDPAWFREVRVDDPLVIQLRERSRGDDDVAGDVNRLTNRLGEQLHRLAALLRLSSSADAPWLWALLELALIPAAGARPEPKQLESSSPSTASGAWMPGRCMRRWWRRRCMSRRARPRRRWRTSERGSHACGSPCSSVQRVSAR